ncbi:uncharacterized protein LOC142326274 [Lycorma delicatula]|uniref:uncharacterized protein LOC142326274 n=1 Tax=Lycorma delicatula TaxID=130591 RepID=UPI003F512B0F
MAKRVSKHHYVATPSPGTPPPSHHHSLISMSSYRNNPGYSTDGEESQRAASDRTVSEYMVANERARVMPPPRKHKTKQRSKSEERERRSIHSQSQSQYNTDHEGSDIYVTSGAYRAPSEISRGSRYSRGARSTHSRAPSHYSYRSPSEVSTIKTKVDRKRGVVVETMSAPNPFCPHTKGMCCLMLLLNLGLILVTLGFVIVIQFFEPLFVWILGIVFLVFGFLTLIGSLIYCVTICRDVKTPSQVAMEDHYWTRHWQKGFGTVPEIHYTTQDKY